MKKLTPGTYLCYRKVGADEWTVERKLPDYWGDEVERIAAEHPDRQWSVFDVNQSYIIDVEKADL